METLVNMTVHPKDVLIGNMIQCDGKVARVKLITEFWDGRYTFIVTCPQGKYSYVYKCTESDRIKLLSI